MKYILYLIFPMIVFSAEPDKKLHQNSLYPTVKISYNKNNCDCDDCKKNSPQAIATGFVVKSVKIKEKTLENKFLNVVVTAAHTVENTPNNLTTHVGNYSNWSSLEKFDSYSTMLYGINQNKDLAVIVFTSDKILPIVEIDFDSKLYFGTDIFKIGYGLGDDVRLDFGQITAIETKSPTKLQGYLRTNAYTIFGDSGGPLFSKENYKVIGVTSSIRGSENIFLHKQSYFSPIIWLKNWDDESKGSLSFIYKEDKKIPETLIFQLWLREFDIKGTRQ